MRRKHPIQHPLVAVVLQHQLVGAPVRVDDKITCRIQSQFYRCCHRLGRNGQYILGGICKWAGIVSRQFQDFVLYGRGICLTDSINQLQLLPKEIDVLSIQIFEQRPFPFGSDDPHFFIHTMLKQTGQRLTGQMSNRLLRIFPAQQKRANMWIGECVADDAFNTKIFGMQGANQ